MKTERRHELEKNQLADGLGRGMMWAEENVRLIAGVVVGVLIIGGVYAVLSNRKDERVTAAWNSYFSAKSGDNTAGLETLAKADSDLLAGQFADMVLADIALNEGLNLISVDRERGETRLNDAKKYYSELRNSRDPKLQERAALGLARYYESMGLIPEAKAEYEKLKDWKGGLYNDSAAQKLAYLEKPATLAFAKWFRDQKPKPRPAGSAMFDPNNLSTMPGFPAGTGAIPAPAASATPTGTPAASATATPSATPAATPTASPSAALPVATPPAASPTGTPAATLPKSP